MDVAEKAILIERDGELSEIAALLDSLAVPVEHWTGPLPEPESVEAARLVIVSASRLLASGTPNLQGWPRTIAVVEDSSRTLAAHLGRLGVSLVMRLPIHPRALRLLLLHEVYRGPERRQRKRTLIGHPIRVGSRLFGRPATLLELSPSGARVELTQAPRLGSPLRLVLGRDLTGGRPLRLETRVVRRIRPSGGVGGARSEVGLALEDARPHEPAIRAILERFALGPAPWKRGSAAPSTARPAPLDPDPAPPRSPEDEPLETPGLVGTKSDAHTEDTLGVVEETSDAAEDWPMLKAAGPGEASPTETSAAVEADEATDEGDHDPSDRRAATRIPYDLRVVALCEEAARVLVGRDLSPTGMRIASTATIEIGDVLRVALHSGTEEDPLVVIADVLRDDAEEGMALSFRELGASQRARIEEIIAETGGLHAGADPLAPDEEPSADAIVVGEVLESSGPLGSAPEGAAHAAQ